MKKVFVKTYGCQMNVYDSERMADAAGARDGYAETDAIEEADLVILNTCHIREKAAEKVYSELGRVRELKDERAAPTASDTLDRGRRLRRPGRGRGDPAPRAGRRPRGRAAELSPPARAGRRRARAGRRGRRDRLPGRGQVRPPARSDAPTPSAASPPS